MREMSGDIMLMSGDTGETGSHILGEVRLKLNYSHVTTQLTCFFVGSGSHGIS